MAAMLILALMLNESDFFLKIYQKVQASIEYLGSAGSNNLQHEQFNVSLLKISQ